MLNFDIDVLLIIQNFFITLTIINIIFFPFAFILRKILEIWVLRLFQLNSQLIFSIIKSCLLVLLSFLSFLLFIGFECLWAKSFNKSQVRFHMFRQDSQGSDMNWNFQTFERLNQNVHILVVNQNHNICDFISSASKRYGNPCNKIFLVWLIPQWYNFSVV